MPTGYHLIRAPSIVCHRYSTRRRGALAEPGEAEAEAAGRIDAAKADEIRMAIRTLMGTENPTPTHHWTIDDLVHSTIAEASENRRLASLIRDLRRRTHIFNIRRIPLAAWNISPSSTRWRMVTRSRPAR
jgi:DNA-binding GntR family transcriptional regulator